MKAKDLLALDDEELSEAFEWIDWRSFESEVVEAFNAQLPPADHFEMEDEESCKLLRHRGKEYQIPLTETGSDRYVMICSLAEILAGRYQVVQHNETLGDDTHGIMVLGHDDHAFLKQNHKKWFERYMVDLLKGLDGFSGLDIPYYGNEEVMDSFRSKREKMDQKTQERREKSLSKLSQKPPWWKFW